MKTATHLSRRVLACLIAAGIGALSGCGGPSSSPSSAGSSQSTASTSAVPSTPAGSQSTAAPSGSGGDRTMEGNLYLEGLPIVKDSETYRIATLKHPLDTGSFPEKYAVKKMEEDTNIHIDWLEIPSSDFETKVNLMFATGDLPDLIVGGVSGSAISKNKSALVKLDEYFEKYAPSLYQTYYVDYPDIAKELTYPDGHIYSFETNAATQPGNACAGIFWYNVKMFEDTGLPIPTNVDEYYEALKKIKEMNPNVIPLTSCENIWSTHFNQLTGPWGILSASAPAVDENGTVFFPAMTDAFYECLKYYHKLSAEGLYDKESFGQTIEQTRAKGNEGILASFVAFSPSELVGDTLKKDYTYFKEPLKGPDGTQLWHGQQDKPTGWREGAVLTSTCKSPETMMRWMDYANSSLEMKLCWQRGEPGKDFIMDEATGKWHSTTLAEREAMGYNQPEGGIWTTANGDHAPVFMTLADIALQDESFQDEDGKLRMEAVDAMRPFFPKPQQFFPRVYQEDDVIEARNNISIELDAYLKEFTATSVVNGIDDAKWQNHLAQMKQLRVEEYIASYQSLYDMGKTG